MRTSTQMRAYLGVHVPADVSNAVLMSNGHNLLAVISLLVIAVAIELSS